MQKVVVKGRTFPIKDELKRDGANWDKEHKYWYFLCGTDLATRNALKAWNDKERKVFAYVEKEAHTEAPETPKERVVLWFKCDSIDNVHEILVKDDKARELAARCIADYGKVYVDMNGDIRDPEGLTLVDVDETRELDWSKDIR